MGLLSSEKPISQTAKWEWNPSTDALFQCLKAWICQTLNTTLAYYNQSKPVIVQTDASKYCLIVALIQCGRLIAFASKTLTGIENCYANIEREHLSVCFGLEKFHSYLYGRHVVTQNDHKPLEMIQHKPINAALPRLQCMLLCMQKFHYTIQYKPGKDMILADCLSQFPSAKESFPIPMHQNTQHIQLSTQELDALQGAIECDLVYSTLYQLTLRRWPDCLQLVPRITQHYLGTLDKLFIEGSPEGRSHLYPSRAP